MPPSTIFVGRLSRRKLNKLKTRIGISSDTPALTKRKGIASRKSSMRRLTTASPKQTLVRSVWWRHELIAVPFWVFYFPWKALDHEEKRQKTRENQNTLFSLFFAFRRRYLLEVEHSKWYRNKRETPPYVRVGVLVCEQRRPRRGARWGSLIFAMIFLSVLLPVKSFDERRRKTTKIAYE